LIRREHLDFNMATTAPPSGAGNTGVFRDKEKPVAVRSSNIVAARAVADAIRTSLGPRGMDKMIRSGRGETIITNDGHTMLKSMAVMHPTAKMLVNLSSAQDVEAGDGTTSVVVICGALLGAADRLLSKGIHPSVISESFQRAAAAAVQILHDMSQPVSLSDSATLLQAANTSLSSKIVSQYSGLLGSMAVNAVTKTIDVKTADNVDLKNIRVIKKVGGTIEDSELVNGLVLTQPVIKAAGGPVRIEKAKIGLIQFQLSPPKPDMENTISVNDYRQMDKIVKEERLYLLDLVKKIKKAKCNVLLIQKSILRDAVNDLSLHFLAKLNILAVKDIERDEVEFICKSTGCKPIADVDSFTEDKLGSADLVEEVQSNGARMVKVTGTKATGKTVSVVCRGANSLILDEAERSLHDALCVIRCLVKKKALIAGGGAPEIEIAAQLSKQARSLTGTEAICWKAFAEALEIIPTTLAENAGLNSIKVVTDLRHRHEMGEKNAGVSIRSGGVNTNIAKENVLQPLLVSTSAIELAAETVKMILRIDDIALTR
jgi:T-complex protein 1 subunit delta